MMKYFLLLLAGSALALSAESPSGVAAHINEHEASIAEKEFTILRDHGIRGVRTDFSWKLVEKSPGNWDYSLFDKNIELAKKYNIELLPILDYDVPWATPAWKHHDKWLEYVRKTVSRYHKQLPYWEVWNEQNGSGFWRGPADPVAYAELLKVTAEEIRKINPDLQILYGGTAGVPHDYIERTLQQGAGRYFDIMNIHPYRPYLPEPSLFRDIRKLKATLQKYGASERLWITEFGNPTAPWGQERRQMIEASLRKLGIDPENVVVAYIDDPAYEFHANMQFDIRRTFEKTRAIRFAELADLDPAETQVVIPCFGEEFPVACFPALKDYIRRGGVVVFNYGIPLYYDWVKNDGGEYQQQKADGKHLAELGIGWEASWQGTGVPGNVSEWNPCAEFAGKIPSFRGFRNDIFLTGANLKNGDRFYPLMEGGTDRKVVQAALYDFNSDLKGAAIVFTQKSPYVSERQQAELLGRAMLISFAAGVEKFYYYELQSLEHNMNYRDQEFFFGIVHRDLSPKPAFHAYRTLTQMHPEGSTRPELLSQDVVWHVKWNRPDGTPVHALWAPFKPEKVKIEAKGKATITDHLGAKLSAFPQELAEGIIYIAGPQEIKVIR